MLLLCFSTLISKLLELPKVVYGNEKVYHPVCHHIDPRHFGFCTIQYCPSVSHYPVRL